MRPIHLLIVSTQEDKSSKLKRFFDAVPIYTTVEQLTSQKSAERYLQRQKPDVIIINIDLPDDQGLSLLRQLRKEQLDLPILVYSANPIKGTSLGAECHSIGISGTIEAPQGLIESIAYFDKLLPELDARLQSLVETYRSKQQRQTKIDPKPYKELGLPSSLRKHDILLIGASTGGVEALRILYQHLGNHLTLPVVTVIHMEETFTEKLPEKLTFFDNGVKMAEQDEVLHNKSSLIAPAGSHTRFKKLPSEKIAIDLVTTPPVNSCRPAIDVTFESAAEIFGHSCVGVILTGMGEDGLQGCQKIFTQGGEIIVQDEETSIVWSMPGSVAKAGIAHKILPITEIGPCLVDRFFQSAIFRR